MTWSQAQAKIADAGLLYRFEASQRVVFWKVSVVAIVAVGLLGAAFAVEGSTRVDFDRETGLFRGLALRAQVSDAAAKTLHGEIARQLGLL